MNTVLLTRGLGEDLVVHQIRHQVGTDPIPATRTVNLLILDSRGMESECFDAACAKVGQIRMNLGLNYGVLFCQTPTLPMTVAAIRCGLRDVINQFMPAARLRALLQSANPGVRVKLREFDAVVSFLRTFGAGAGAESPVADLARREQELTKRAEQMKETEARLAVERDSFASRDRDLRERTRRFDRQLALQQNDADVAPTPAPSFQSGPPFAELQALARRLEQRAAELDYKEKLLTEMQSLLSAQADGMARPSN